ncbi:DUF1684 domain-containing protein [Streptomyces alkaliterrae]|uniref:DUF1684 domain-containing protein n=1 Tax=Streptomyces alkaliterrae TaxID=2213162 RepID=A0A5P0YN75_9ACTN|nr:DUF1684 domain-containing protein [Streptomyces alkaliterrae]MBB1253511.1 DUF1684 domain-containing protein [Streptomyces alkaliterrae]MBB1258034.1 DUF1684 domain-containing protein [Streptomyces alkaliterrae]MQS01804.1 DUF1684 domain-containing protein [Streptomyces alkaliterrae]
MTTDAASAQQWQEWHQQRLDAVRAPYGPLSVTGTYWIAEATADGALEGVPGRWHQTADAVVLRADIMDGLMLDGEPLVGEAELAPGPQTTVRVQHGERRLELLRREGQWAVRVHDPSAPARRVFTGIRTTPYDPHWSLVGHFRPYQARREVRVENADGRERTLELGGEVVFTAPDAREHTLAVSVVGSGALWAVFADGTSGESSYRFRFLRTGAPGPDGSVRVDFNRATLPPSAFADGFLCPFPPPGNTLDTPVPVGERDVAR